MPSTDIVGPPGWIILHTLENELYRKNIYDFEEFVNFLKNFGKCFPCEICRYKIPKHVERYIFTQSNERLVFWIHKEVNLSLNKPAVYGSFKYPYTVNSKLFIDSLEFYTKISFDNIYDIEDKYDNGYSYEDFINFLDSLEDLLKKIQNSDHV